MPVLYELVTYNQLFHNFLAIKNKMNKIHSIAPLFCVYPEDRLIGFGLINQNILTVVNH